MSNNVASSLIWWIMCIVSVALFFGLIFTGADEWFWVAIPFMFTGFIKGMDWI